MKTDVHPKTLRSINELLKQVYSQPMTDMMDSEFEAVFGGAVGGGKTTAPHFELPAVPRPGDSMDEWTRHFMAGANEAQTPTRRQLSSHEREQIAHLIGLYRVAKTATVPALCNEAEHALHGIGALHILSLTPTLALEWATLRVLDETDDDADLPF